LDPLGEHGADVVLLEARAAGRGYQKRLKVIWDDKNPDKSFRSTNSLACQAYAIINSKLLTEYELHDIQRHFTTGETGSSDASSERAHH